MSAPTTSERVALCIAEYRQLLESGEAPAPDAFRDRLGHAYPEFLAALTETLDGLIQPSEPAAETFPRAFGPFLLFGRLGAGGMGVVYDALHRTLGRRVAVKVLHPHVAEREVARERFKREAQACANIRHRNVVEVYDAGEVNGFAYYSMEFLEGTSLASLAPDQRPSITDLLRGLAEIADALDHLHREGVIHRDVKPSNIVMRRDGRMVLADFGLVKAPSTGELTVSGNAIGTPLYASPEQLRGDSARTDARTDIYSLGATIYDVVAGSPPLQADDIAGLLRAVLNDRPPPLPAELPEVPAGLDRVVQKALEKHPEDRYATATALRDDLLALAEGRPALARPVPLVTRSLRGLRRYAWPLVVAFILVAATSLWAMTRRATLRVTSFPPAAVHIDDEHHGITPVAVELTPGMHRLRLGRRGFGEFEEEIDLSPGSERDVHQVLVVGESDAFEAICCLADALGITIVEDLADVVADVDLAGDADVALLPRGEVREDDLTHWWVDDSTATSSAGRVVFSRDGEELATVGTTLSDGAAHGPLPAAVRAVLRPGETISWGWYPEVGEPNTASFRLTRLDVDEELRGIRTRLHDQPPAVVRHLQAEVLLSRGLPLSAFLAAGRIGGSGACEERAQEIRRAALRQLGVAPDRQPYQSAPSEPTATTGEAE